MHVNLKVTNRNDLKTKLNLYAISKMWFIVKKRFDLAQCYISAMTSATCLIYNELEPSG